MMSTYAINPHKINTDVADVFVKLPKECLLLKDIVKHPLKDNTFQIKGTSSIDWVVEEIGLSLTNVQITIIESADQKVITFSELEASKKIGAKTFIWKAKETDLGVLFFKCEELHKNPLTKKEIVGVPFLSGLDSLNDLGSFMFFEYQFHLIGFGKLRLTHTWISNSKKNIDFGNGLFEINKIELIGATAIKENKSENPWETLSLKSKIDLVGLNSELTIGLSSPNNYICCFELAGTDVISSFEQLLKKLKLSSFITEVSKFNKEIPLLKNIAVYKIIAQFNREKFSLRNISLYAKISCFDVHFNVEINYSNPTGYSIKINLEQGNFLSLKDLIGRIMNPQLHLTSNPQIGHLNISFNTKFFTYSLDTRLTCNWVFNFGAESFVIKKLSFYMAKINDSQYSFRFEGSFLFNRVNFELFALKEPQDSSSGWLLETQGAQSTQIHLKNLLSELAQLFHFPHPDHIPDITVSSIDLSFHTHTHDFHLELEVDLQEPGIGPFNKGEVTLTIDLTKNEKGSHDFCMNLDGIININDTELDVNGNDIGQKDWSVDIVWDHKENESLSIFDIGKLFGLNTENPDLQKVKDLLILNHLEWHYQHGYPETEEQDALPTHFLLIAKLGKDSKTTVEGLFSGKNPKIDNKSWDFMIGIGYTDHTQIPDIGKRIPDFKLDDAWLLINTADTQANQWPPLPPDFPKTIEQQSVEKGLIAMAKLDLAESKNSKAIPGAGHLSKTLPHTALNLLVEIDGKGLLMEALLEGTVSIPTGQGHSLVVDKAGIQLTITSGLSTSIALWGFMDFKLDTVSDSLKIELDVDETGMELLTDVKFNSKAWKPFGLKDVFIDELDLALGIDFEPPGIRIGFEGEMHLKDQTKDAEKLAVVLEFTEPIPNPEYLAIAIKQLNLSDILNLCEGSSKEGHDQIKNSIAEIDDFAVVWCEKPIVLPDGKTAQLGFSCHGAVKILSWGAYIRLDVHPQTGIQGMGELSPLKIGPLQISGKGTGVSVKQHQLSDGTWEDVSNVVVNPKKNELCTSTVPTRMHQLIAPGGAIIQFNSAGTPYLNLSIGVQFFEVKIAEIDAKIDKDSFTFDMLLNLAGIAGFKVHAHIQQQPELQFDISGAFFLGIHFVIDIHLPWPLPHIHLDFQLGVNASMGVSKDKEGCALKLGGGVLFMGHKIDLGHFEIHGIPDSLGKLPSWIFDYIKTGHVPKFKQHISDGSGVNTYNPYNKKKIELAEEMLAKAKEWASFVHRDIEKLKQERNLSIDKIQQLIDDVKADTTKIQENNTDTKTTSNAAEEKGHLSELNQTISGDMTDAFTTRESEIQKMQLEIQWIKDEQHTLKGLFQAAWDKLMVASTPFDKALKELKTQSQTFTIPNTDPAVKFPNIALEHQYFMFIEQRKIHQKQHEIRETAKEQVQNILTEMTQIEILEKSLKK